MRWQNVLTRNTPAEARLGVGLVLAVPVTVETNRIIWVLVHLRSSSFSRVENAAVPPAQICTTSMMIQAVSHLQKQSHQ